MPRKRSPDYDQGLTDVSSPRGAPHGRPDTMENPEAVGCRCYRLRFEDGCYDRGGAYWGAPENVYRIVDSEGDVELYVRAANRAAAKKKVNDRYPKLRWRC